VIPCRDKALRLVPSLNENCDKIFSRQYLSYVFLRKIFGEGWLVVVVGGCETGFFSFC
jgi:hypothetical protein